jgi:hypothetical protein
MRAIDDLPHGYGDPPDGPQPTRLPAAIDPGLLAVGAVLLMCAPLLPGPARLVVLPALLLAPGYAFLRLLGRAVDMRSISLAVPVSIVLIVCASLILDVSHVRLGPVSLGLLLGALTALFVLWSYGRQMIADRTGSHRRQPPDDWDLVQRDPTVSERR